MNKIERSIEEIFEFGWKYFIRYRLIGRIRGCAYKQQTTLSYLRDRYGWVARTELLPMCVEPNPYPDTIWVCWWQGEDQMPEIVRACYASLKKYCNGHPIRLITKDNYREYIELPDWVETKFHEGKISITHMSDYIRFSLLSLFGGLWMDATLYLTGNLPKKIPYFFTLKQEEEYNDSYISRHRWAGYCLGGNMRNPLWRYTYEFLLMNYWREHSRLIDYFIMDYAIEILYEGNRYIRRIIDICGYSNPDVAFFSKKGNEKFNADRWKEITERTQIFKLSWKADIRIKTDEGKCTYYGYVMGYE